MKLANLNLNDVVNRIATRVLWQRFLEHKGTSFEMLKINIVEFNMLLCNRLLNMYAILLVKLSTDLSVFLLSTYKVRVPEGQLCHYNNF